MDQDNRNSSGFNIPSGSDRGIGSTGSTGSTGSMGSGSSFGSTGSSGFGAGTSGASDIETCAHCGSAIGQGHNSGLEQFLGKIGISDDMVNTLKSSFQNVDMEEYLNTAREYLKSGSGKATTFAKDNPGKIAAGVAVLAVGAGLLINSLRDRDNTARIDIVTDEGDRNRTQDRGRI